LSVLLVPFEELGLFDRLAETGNFYLDRHGLVLL
jgi:hypothetical protein